MSAYTERIREDRVTTKEDITMKFELARSGNLLIVQVAGELDHHFADEIRMRIDAEIMKPPVRNILFDFNRLSFMDSSGIGMIMGRYKKIKALGGKAWIICNNPNATRILEMSGVFKFIEKCRDVHDAV
jgi:anti-sigma F factor antagonist